MRCISFPKGTGRLTIDILGMKARKKAKDDAAAGITPTIEKTSELYRVPYLRNDDAAWYTVSKESITWPKYIDGIYKNATSGESMLELSEDEKRSLQLVVLKTSVEKETFGSTCAPSMYNWKKTQLSRAYWRPELVCREKLPTARAKAAFDWLMQQNRFYKDHKHFAN